MEQGPNASDTSDTYRWHKNDRHFAWKAEYEPINCFDSDQHGVMVGRLNGRDLVVYDMEWKLTPPKVFEHAEFIERGMDLEHKRGSLIGIRLNGSLENLSMHFSRKKDKVPRPKGLDYPIGLENIYFADKYEIYASAWSANSDIFLKIFPDDMQYKLIDEDLILPFTILAEHPDIMWLCLESSPFREEGFDPAGLKSLIVRYEDTLKMLESFATSGPQSEWPPDGGEKDSEHKSLWDRLVD